MNSRRGHLYYFAQAVVAGCVYYLLVRLGLSFRVGQGANSISLFWPPAGFALAVLTRGHWKGFAYLVAAFVAASIPANLSADRPWSLVLMFTVDDVLLPAAGAVVLRRMIADQRPLGGSQQTIAFIVVTALASFLSANIGVAALKIENPDINWLLEWRKWATSVMIGILMIAPPILSFSRELWRSISRRKILEGIFVQVLLAVPTFVAFHRQDVSGLPVRLFVYASIPLMLWSALRSGVFGAAVSLFVIGAVGVTQIALSKDYTLQSSEELVEELAWMQAYYAAVGFSSLMVGALFQEFQQSLADRKLQSSILSMIAAGKPLHVILEQLVLGIESRVPEMIGSVLMVNPDGETLRTAAAPNLPKEYNDLIVNYPIGDGNGSCGTAAFRKELVIVDDMYASPHWAEFLPAVRKHKLRACWSQPIMDSAGRVHGTFAMYYRMPRTPTNAELDLIRIAADLAEVAIERDQFVNAIRERERSYSSLISNLTGMAFRVRLSHDGLAKSLPIYFSEGALELTGYTADELRKMNPALSDIVNPDDLQRLRSQLIDAISRKDVAFSCEYRIRTRNGSERWLWNQSKIMYADDGTAEEIEGFISNITERKQAEFALQAARHAAEQASKAKDQFLAMLSHELRTPLTPVLLYASMMERQPDLPEETREEIRIIKGQIEQETRLIDDLLDVTRIDRGKFRIDKKPVDFRKTIEKIVQLTTPTLDEKGHTLSVSLEASSHHLFADPSRMEQLVLNLLSNSIKFTRKGHIKLRTYDCGKDRLCLQVSDNGIGMTAEDIRHLFNPFEQGARARSPEFGGLGLGLTIVKAILDLHGGSIRVESEGEGKGATISVELPVIAEVAQPEAPAPATEDVSNLKILVVEDHEASRDVLVTLLKTLGHTVVGANGIESALKHRDESFDLLLSDIQLPDGSGLNLLQQFKKIRPIKAIALSGLGTDADLERSEAAGFAAHLVKPIDLNVLEKTIAEVMSG